MCDRSTPSCTLIRTDVCTFTVASMISLPGVNAQHHHGFIPCSSGAMIMWREGADEGDESPWNP